ncbi:MAG: hypothetical protein FJX40_06555 [Alphaproteobacteria bacterium]|nr:hypothetical protein [Alphaproteobacteria bacterium]
MWLVIASEAKQSRKARGECWIASSATPPRNDVRRSAIAQKPISKRLKIAQVFDALMWPLGHRGSRTAPFDLLRIDRLQPAQDMLCYNIIAETGGHEEERFRLRGGRRRRSHRIVW